MASKYSESQIIDILKYDQKYGYMKTVRDMGISRHTLTGFKKRYAMHLKQEIAETPAEDLALVTTDPDRLQKLQIDYIALAHLNKIKALQTMMKCIQKADDAPDPKYVRDIALAIKYLNESIPTEEGSSANNGFQQFMKEFHYYTSAPVKNIDITDAEEDV